MLKISLTVVVFSSLETLTSFFPHKVQCIRFRHQRTGQKQTNFSVGKRPANRLGLLETAGTNLKERCGSNRVVVVRGVVADSEPAAIQYIRYLGLLGLTEVFP
jgi:hypothetical protein